MSKHYPKNKQHLYRREEPDIEIMDDQIFANKNDNPIQRIKVIGVGGGGNNAVIHMYKKGIKDVSFVLLNTDRQVLDASEVPNKVLIGTGRGAGGKPELARKYAEESAERIADLFDDKTDMVFITAGMGGGTGTGAGPVVARIAKEKGILTVGIITVPFKFEGKQKIDKALKGAAEMAKNVDSLLVINNQRLADIYKNYTILNAFAKADDTLLNAAQSITDIITYQGIINRDFNDVDTTLREGGTAIISTGYGEGENRVTKAIQDALHSPLLRNTDIFTSKKLLLILYINDDLDKHPFNMDETDALTEFVSGIDNGDIEVMWGLYQTPGLKDKVRITILAAGFEQSYDEMSTIEGSKRASVPVSGPTQGRNPGLAPLKGGIVLNPEDYDNPECDAVREFERIPAIDRNPYRKYMTGMDNRSHRGSHIFEEHQDVDMPTNIKTEDKKPTERPKDDDTLIIDFSDM